MATTYHVEADQSMTVFGPAKLSLVADEPPQIAALAPPTVSALAPNTAVAGDATPVTMVVTGTGFRPGSVIVFNGFDEPTTFVSDTEVSTDVTPALFTVPAVCPVSVRSGGQSSAPLDFTFT